MTKNKWNDTWDDFLKKATKAIHIVVFGGGYRCKRLLPYLMKRIHIDFIVDSDKDKDGMDIYGIKIHSPEYFWNIVNDDYLILICGMKVTEIAEKLEKKGLANNIFSEFYMENENLHNARKCGDYPKESIARLDAILSDIDSKNIVKKIIEKRIEGRIEYDDIRSEGESYFREEFFQFKDDEVLVDGGSFDGDTIDSFVLNHSFKKIYAFEPDEKNYLNLSNSLSVRLFSEKIECRKEGLGSKNEEMFFWQAGDECSYIGEKGEKEGVYSKTIIQCTCIDNLEKANEISFIKMDIEGSELVALKGAMRTIQMNRPKLAICIYHNIQDLWEIPLFIHDIVPEYKLYIRHYGMGYTDTILYATL